MVETMALNIYQAKKDGVRAAVPQAAIAAVSYCRRHKSVIHVLSLLDIYLKCDFRRLSTFRGCVTSGESWVFFVYNENDGGEGGSCSISEEMKTDSDKRLAQIIGLLKDWASVLKVYNLDHSDINASDHSLEGI